MNNPEIWLIPLIMIIVWIVSSFARSGDNDKSKNRQQRTVRGERPATEKTWQRPSSEIDRFLEEVNRRRRQAGDRRPTAEEPPRPLPASLSRSQQATAPRQAPSPPRSTDRGKSANKRPASPAPSAKAPGPTAAALRVSEIEAINVPEVLPVAAASARRHRQMHSLPRVRWNNRLRQAVPALDSSRDSWWLSCKGLKALLQR